MRLFFQNDNGILNNDHFGEEMRTHDSDYLRPLWN